MRPYYVPNHRQRTKSENEPTTKSLQVEPSCSFAEMDTDTPPIFLQPQNKAPKLKKSKSLEDVRVETNFLVASNSSHEMEFVSKRIQNLQLKVQEWEDLKQLLNKSSSHYNNNLLIENSCEIIN